MPIGWWGILDQLRIAVILIGSGAIVFGFAMLLVRGIRRAWRTPDQ
jgi:hypothetical protein